MPAPMMIVSYMNRASWHGAISPSKKCTADSLSGCPLQVLHARRKVTDRAGHAGQGSIFLFRNLDAVPLAQLHHNVQKIHAVQFELVTEGHIVLEVAEIFIRSNIAK